MSPAFYERGITQMSLNQLDKALTDFDQALALARVYDLAKAARGVVLLMKGNSAEGLADINAVLERIPSNQTAVFGRGLALVNSGQFDRAIVALDTVVGKTADDSMARTLRARAYLGKGETRNALADLDIVLKARPADASALTLRGSVFSALRDYPKALKDLNEAIERRETIESYVCAGAGLRSAERFRKGRRRLSPCERARATKRVRNQRAGQCEEKGSAAFETRPLRRHGRQRYVFVICGKLSPSLRGAKRRSNPWRRERIDGLLRYARNDGLTLSSPPSTQASARPHRA